MTTDTPCPRCGELPTIERDDYGEHYSCDCPSVMGKEWWNTRANSEAGAIRLERDALASVVLELQQAAVKRAAKPWLTEPTCSGYWWMREVSSGETHVARMLVSDKSWKARTTFIYDGFCYIHSNDVDEGQFVFQGPIEPEV